MRVLPQREARAPGRCLFLFSFFETSPGLYTQHPDGGASPHLKAWKVFAPVLTRGRSFHRLSLFVFTPAQEWFACHVTDPLQSGQPESESGKVAATFPDFYAGAGVKFF